MSQSTLKIEEIILLTSKVYHYCKHNTMDNYLTEQQVEELINFDSVEKDLMDLIEEEQKFSMDEYLNSNIDY